VQCAESLRVQAYFDGEVDAVSATEIERHVEHCDECRALLQDLKNVRAVLRRDVAYAAAPPALRAQIFGALDAEEAGQKAAAPAPPLRRPAPPRSARPRWFWTGAFSGLGAAAVAASMAFFLIMPRNNVLTDDLLNAHVRSLMPAHLIDVESTDRHTVKPWFAGHADVSPVVADFEPQGYRLIGGRADYIDHQRSAVVVYQHGAHLINVFAWAAEGRPSPRNTTRNGYRIAFWQQGDIQYAAVSDTGWDELLGLTRLLRDLS
jgi:anti-sigma factor (TIGR02949 family)